MEKITGVDIYSKIGIKVFEVTGQKKTEWEQAQQKIEGIHTLTDEEMAAKKEEMAAKVNHTLLVWETVSIISLKDTLLFC